jgi:hypothetical protein
MQDWLWSLLYRAVDLIANSWNAAWKACRSALRAIDG